jgi:hypothetical protein
MISPRDTHWGAPSASTASATSRPLRKQPVTLIVNVAQGRASRRVLDQGVDAVPRQGAETTSESDGENDGHGGSFRSTGAISRVGG